MSWRNFIVGYFPLLKSVINLPTTYTNKGLQLPVFDKNALDSVILYGGKTCSSSSWGGVSELIPPHDAINNVKCLR